MILTDTIIAISSPPGPARRGIIRLTGPDAWQIASQLLPLPTPLTPGWHGPLSLPLLHPTAKIAHALLFQSPRSFTGQNIAELHLPASPALLNALIEKALSLNPTTLRLADPGEFSARAFFNGKIDLTQAEGIAATINAANESQLRAAASLRSGNLHRRIADIADQVAGLLALVEAGIDFTDEEGVHFIEPDDLISKLSQIEVDLHWIVAHAVRLDRLDVLPSVVFIGKPNVGKSSLINALTRTERSITSPVAGTTRDMLSAILHTPAGDIRLIDVPGEETPVDELQKKMMDARQIAILEADLIIRVITHPTQVDVSHEILGQYPAYAVTVQNKVDLLPPELVRTFEYYPDTAKFATWRGEWQIVSAKTQLHLEELRQEIARLVSQRGPISANLPALNQRHRAILQEVKHVLSTASNMVLYDSPIANPELLAAELRLSLDLLGQITGAISPDEIIGRIFSQFCIGK